MKILAISGSLRKDSYNTRAIHSLSSLAPSGVEVKTATLEKIPLFSEDLESEIPESITKLIELIHWADGLIISTPEYSNHVPGVLVNTLNWLSRKSVGHPLKGKRVAIMGASTGGFGTARSQLQLQSLLHVMAVIVPSRISVKIARAQEKFDDKGNIVDSDLKEKLGKLLKDFVDYLGE